MLKRAFLAAFWAAAAVVYPAHATVTASYAPPSYSCDGVITAYSISFPYLATSHLVVTSTTAAGVATTLALTTDYTVSPAIGPTSGTLTLTAGSKCPSGSTLKIARSVPLTQPTPLRTQGQYFQSTVEAALDRLEMQLQQVQSGVANPVSPSTVTNATTVTATGSSTPRQLADWFADPSNAKANGAVADGVTDASGSIQASLTNRIGVTYLPPSAACYSIGTTTISIPAGRTLAGAGMGGPSNGPSCIVYTGTGCAILLDSVASSGLRDLDVQVNSASPTARGVCLYDTTGTNEFNTVQNVSIKQTNATRRVAGQVGLLLRVTTANGVYWNHIENIRLAYWDTAVQLVGSTAPVNGANANNLSDLMSWGHVTAVQVITNSNDNEFVGIKCSRSDGTYVGSPTCLLVGDNTNGAFGNSFFHVLSDQGNPNACATIGSAAGATELHAACESGGVPTDNNTTAFPSLIYTQVGGSGQSTISVGRIALAKGFNNTTGHRAIRIAAGCSTLASIGSNCTTGPINWATAFADSNYTLTCTLTAVTAQPHIVGTTKTGGASFTVTIAADTAVAATGTLECIADHD